MYLLYKSLVPLFSCTRLVQKIVLLDLRIGVEFKNSITSEEAAVCISYGIGAKSFGFSYV